MASTAEKRMYEEADFVDEYLLNQVSKWILYHRLGALARDLEISQAEFSRIATPSSTPEEQIFQVHLHLHILLQLLYQPQSDGTTFTDRSNLEILPAVQVARAQKENYRNN